MGLINRNKELNHKNIFALPNPLTKFWY